LLVIPAQAGIQRRRAAMVAIEVIAFVVIAYRGICVGRGLGDASAAVVFARHSGAGRNPAAKCCDGRDRGDRFSCDRLSWNLRGEGWGGASATVVFARHSGAGRNPAATCCDGRDGGDRFRCDRLSTSNRARAAGSHWPSASILDSGLRRNDGRKTGAKSVGFVGVC